jgi:PTS system cellobiose-specific IIC component
LKERFNAFLRDKVGPFLDRYENNIYIMESRNIMISIIFPLAIIGSLFYIAANPPRGTDWGLFKIWLSSAVEVRDHLMIVYYFTFGILSLLFAGILSYRLARLNNVNPLLCQVVSVLSFLILCFAGSNPRELGLETMIGSLGPNGLLMALLTVIACIAAIKLLNSKKIGFDVSKDVSSPAALGFQNLFPLLLIMPLAWALGWVMSRILGGPVPSGIVLLSGSMASSFSGLIRDMALAVSSSASYLLGMDGSLIRQPVSGVLMNLGGFSTLLPLAVFFMLSYSKQLKHIGISTIVPTLFNLPYPLIAAAPVILNPIYVIPAILCSVVTAAINYSVLQLGLLTVTVEATSTLPVFFSGYFASGGRFMGVIIQAINFAAAALVYYPFFRYHESRLLEAHGSEKDKALAKEPFIKRFTKTNTASKASKAESLSR